MLKLFAIALGGAVLLVLVIAVIGIATSKPAPVTTANPAPAASAEPTESLSVSGGVVEVRLPPTDHLLEGPRHGELRRVRDRMNALAVDPTHAEAQLFQVWTQVKTVDSAGAEQLRPGVTVSIKPTELAKFNFDGTTPEDFERFARSVGSVQVNPALR